MKSMFIIFALVAGFAQAGTRTTVSCWNAKDSVFIFFCMLNGQIDDQACDTPQILFQGKYSDEKGQPKVGLIPRTIDLTKNSNTMNLSLFVPDDETNLHARKAFEMKNAILDPNGRVNDPKSEVHYKGVGQLNLPQGFEEKLKSEMDIDFDLKEAYSCIVGSSEQD